MGGITRHGTNSAEDFDTGADMPPVAIEIECALVERMPLDIEVRMGRVVFALEASGFLFMKCRDMVLKI